MLQNHLKKYQIILASKSPRRSQLLKELGIDFSIENKNIAEIYPPGLDNHEVALYLSQLKADPFKQEIQNTNKLVITSDTIVCLGQEILGKPTDRDLAIAMLQKLSDQVHEVITGVTLTSAHKTKSFTVATKVYFKALQQDEIVSYIDQYKPFDKAGGYGIQEWIGMIGIEKIEGSYFNVMGLPVQRLYTELYHF
ncbi:Maf family nucleotide pyrophosphatase [Saccharicrinis fermentans]|uniref:dTTP/UTP pyrophosphatase n=1 Tax=Saccharicrinis fermentans DSM 9555 = JCM 21142 TaxID=869213 RepID=W7Y3T4_9BACT|nr:Maf family nucleotide pyrophosphatase [Saccharicrinis fermentans]GAF02243.1 septum formation protein Maf [Saccharicrinis fermentans DSM 9555 = JCM 21142]